MELPCDFTTLYFLSLNTVPLQGVGKGGRGGLREEVDEGCLRDAHFGECR